MKAINIPLERRQIEAIALNLRELVGDDDQAYHDMLSGETDLFEIVRRLLNWIEVDEGVTAALVAQIGDRNFRKERAQHRIEGYREAIMALLQAARLDKLKLPEATISLRKVDAKLAVTDPDAVPDEYTNTPKPKPSMTAINEAFSPDDETLPNWLRVEPESSSISIRRK